MKGLDELFLFARTTWDYYEMSMGPGTVNNSYAWAFLETFELTCDKISKIPGAEAGAALLLIKKEVYGWDMKEELQDYIQKQKSLSLPKKETSRQPASPRPKTETKPKVLL